MKQKPAAAGPLFPIARDIGRVDLRRQAGAPLPFHGVDIWNCYELSWLDAHGKPCIALAELRVPADSPCLIESKSLKLYLNGFVQERFDSFAALELVIARDLTAAAGAVVEVVLVDAANPARPGRLEGECIDAIPIAIDHYAPPAPELLVCGLEIVTEALVSHLFKSNCPVSGQPDWASVQIVYTGPRLDRGGLLAYLCSYRQHAAFHEHCVERVFSDIWWHCQPQQLSVYARYTRRGGIDINPFRSSDARSQPENLRLWRQ